MDKYINELIKKQKKEAIIKKDIISNNNYIEWIVSFLESSETHRFCDDDWSYCPESISKENMNNVDKLHLFLDMCIEKTRSNFIPVYFPDSFYGAEMYIKYNDIYLYIGTISGQGTFFFAELVTEIDGHEYIDWSLIINNVISDVAKEKKEILSKLETEIKEAIKKGVNLNYIYELVNQIKEDMQVEEE